MEERHVSLSFGLDDKWGIFQFFMVWVRVMWLKMISTNNVKLVVAIYNMNHQQLNNI